MSLPRSSHQPPRSAMPYDYLKVDSRDGVCTITMHDPATRNALGHEMAAELMEELDRFEDDPEGRVLLLTGSEPSFCSGANVRGFSKEIREQESAPAPAALPWGDMEAQLASREKTDRALAAQVPLRIYDLQKPSIAAVNGHAVGVGMGLALSCDIRLASEKAVFSEAFVKMGLIPGDGSCWQLPKLIGLSNTLLLQYTGDRIDGAEAYRLGLVSKVLPDDELLDAATELAHRLAQGPVRSMSLIKYLVHKSLDLDFRESMELAHTAQQVARGTEDHAEAVQAFLEKRPPVFKGR